ncbi:MAG: ABC transporter substrate-binding protein [Beutenbergiaceae bacterium]
MRSTQSGIRRRGAVATAMFAIAAVVTGCAAGGGGSGGGQEQADIGASAEEFLAEAGQGLTQDSISVLVQSAPQAESIEAISQQFTELTGVDVEWTVLDEESATNKASVALGSADGGYDVIQTPSNLISTYASRGWVQSIDDLSSNADLAVPGWDRAAFGDGLNNLLTVGGDQFGVPMFIGTQIYYYRTDVFEEAGITEPPTTFEELVDIAKAVHSDDVAGIALRSAPDISQLLFVWSSWLYGYGGQYYDSVTDGVYADPVFDSPEAVAALTDYADLLQNYAPSGATNWNVSDVVRAFASGRVAIIQEGAVFGGTFNDPTTSQVAGNVGTFVIPGGPAGTYIPYVTHGWTVASNSQASDAAWLFVQWATLQETLVAATQQDNNFTTPPIAAVYESSEYEERYGFDNYVDSVVDTLATADAGGVSPLDGDPNFQPSDESWNTIGLQIAQELSKAVTGQVSPSDAVAAAAGALE